MSDLLPCPFCGLAPDDLDYTEGSTYRWLAWSCPGCAIGGEERQGPYGDADRADAAKASAREFWSQRAAIPQPEPPSLELSDEHGEPAPLSRAWLMELADLCASTRMAADPESGSMVFYPVEWTFMEAGMEIFVNQVFQAADKLLRAAPQVEAEPVCAVDLGGVFPGGIVTSPNFVWFNEEWARNLPHGGDGVALYAAAQAKKPADPSGEK